MKKWFLNFISKRILMLSLLKQKLRKSRNEKETSMDQKIILSDILPGYSQFKTTLF